MSLRRQPRSVSGWGRTDEGSLPAARQADSPVRRERNDLASMADEDFVDVPVGSGWFGYSNSPRSIERYGLTLDQYDAMLKEQNDSCAICGRPPAAVGPLVVDHDHQSDHVRGLLCQRCNRGIGQFLEVPTFLEAAANYIHERGSWYTRGESTPETWFWNAPILGDGA